MLPLWAAATGILHRSALRFVHVVLPFLAHRPCTCHPALSGGSFTASLCYGTVMAFSSELRGFGLK